MAISVPEINASAVDTASPSGAPPYRGGSSHAEPIDALTLGIERAFDGRHFWRAFVREVRAADIEALDL